MTDFDRIRILYRTEENSIIELMNAMYYAKSTPEINSLKKEMLDKIKSLASKKECMLIIDNMNAGGVSNGPSGRSKEEVGR